MHAVSSFAPATGLVNSLPHLLDVGTRADLSSGMANMRPLVGARDVNDLTGVFDLSAKANGVSGFLRTVGSLVQRRPQSAVGCKTNY